MHFTSEARVDEVVERAFMLNGIRGILWVPESASTPSSVPLILLAPPPGPAGLDVSRPRLLGRAFDVAQLGFASVTIEAPGSGGRPLPAGVADARVELRSSLAAGGRVPEDVVDRFILPVVDQAVPEWRATLDAVLGLPGIGGPVGYSGGVISVGIRLATTDDRISAALLFAGSYVPRSIVEEARRLTIPLYVLLQWDDEGNDRQMALDLFDALGSREKTLNANMGGHTGVPPHAGEAANQFFSRHLHAPGR